MFKRRILILDFDFYTAIGGGQTFYRRILERHPDTEFWYPSRGPDCRAAGRGGLPPNARPFAFDQFAETGAEPIIPSDNYWQNSNAIILAGVAAPLQGMSFAVVEIPSFFPVAHLVRGVFNAFGIVLGGITQGLLGWMSVGLRNGYDPEIGKKAAISVERSEALSVAASDITYAISDLHAQENVHYAPEALIDMRDALEEFPFPPADPPGEGPPDIWFVGRLDRNKGPDLFLQTVARIPRHLFGRCRFAGPDNAAWATEGTWSESLLELAESLGLDAVYAGELADDVLRADVYGGRSVLLVPSRADAFNYVALEALANGCPIVLSRHAGAADYLHQRCPDIAPPIVDPEDVAGTAAALQSILENYEHATRQVREKLMNGALPRPNPGFMDPIFDTAMERSKARPVESGADDTILTSPVALRWRPLPVAGDVFGTAVVVVRDDPAGLVATLASLQRQSRRWQIVVVDDGSADPRAAREIVRSFSPEPLLLRQGRQGFGWAANRGWSEAGAEPVCIMRAGDILDAAATDQAIAAFADPSVAAWVPASSPVNAPCFYAAADADTHCKTAILRRDILEQTSGLRVGQGAAILDDLLRRAAALGRVQQDEGRTMVWNVMVDAMENLPQTAGPTVDESGAMVARQPDSVQA